MTIKTLILWIIAMVGLALVAAFVSSGPIRLIAIIGILLISFVLQGTIIRYKK